MAYKVNYGLERAERNRAKQAKKEAKLREREARAKAGTTDPEHQAEAADSAEISAKLED